MCDRNIDDNDDQPQEPRPIGENYLLVVGINYKETSFRKLNNAVADAAAFLNVVLDRYHFFDPRTAKTETPQEIDTPKTAFLIDPDQKKLDSKIAELTKNLKEEDNLLIYFAGHGKEDVTGVYLIPSDGKKDRPGSWIDIKKMVATLTVVNLYTKKQRCRNLLMILDCCYSAGALSGLSSTRGNLDLSRYVIASAVGKAPDGNDKAGSPFRLALQELLEENDAPFYSIDENKLREKLQKFLAIQNIKIDQSIRSGPIPSDYDNGTGRFIFELCEPNIPPVKAFCKGYLKHLNFEEERRQFRKEIVNKKGRKLGFINLFESTNHLMITKKALREELSKYFKGYDIKKELRIYEKSLMEGIWEHLYRAMHQQSSDEISMTEQLKQNILIWLFNQAKVSEDHFENKVGGVYFLNIFIEKTNKLLLTLIKDFCRDVVVQYNSITMDLADNCRLLIVVTEVKDDKERWFDLSGIKSSQVGILIQNPTECVQHSEIIDWLDKLKTDLSNIACVQALKEEAFLPFEGNSVEAFIEESCKVVYNSNYNSKKDEIILELYHDLI